MSLQILELYLQRFALQCRYQNMKRKTSSILFLVGSVLLNFALGATGPTKSAELFQTSKVWTIHLKWTVDQWEAMEPKGGQHGPGGAGAFAGRGLVALVALEQACS